MADSIGSLSLRISASSADFDKTLDSAHKKLEHFAKAATAPLRVFGGVTGGINAVLEPIASAVSKIPFVGGALGASFGSVGEIAATVRETTKEIVLQKREADILGLSLKESVGFRLGAGAGAEGLPTVLHRLSAELGAVAMGSEEARKKFRALGLDGEQLAEMPFGEAVKHVADYVKGLGSAQEKANVLKQLGGRGGVEQVPFFSLGRAGIERAEHHAVASGLAPSPAEVAQLQQAQTAFREMDHALEAIKIKLAIFSVPYVLKIKAEIEEAAEGEGGLVGLNNLVGKLIRQGIDEAGGAAWGRRIAGFIRPTAGVRESARPSAASAAATRARERLEQADRQADDLIESIQAKTGAAGSSLGPHAEAIQKLSRSGASPAKVTEALEAARAGETETVRQGIQEQARGVRDAINVFGRAFETAEMEAAIRKGGEGVRGAVGALKENLMDLEGKRLVQEAEGPLGEFKRAQDKLRQLLAFGVIGQNVFDIGQAKAFARLQGVAGEYRAAPALTVGSQAATDLIAAQAGGAGAPDVAGVMREVANINQKQLEAAQEIARKLDALKPPQPVQLGARGGG